MGFISSFAAANRGYNEGVDTNDRRAIMADQLRRMRQAEADESAARRAGADYAQSLQMPGNDGYDVSGGQSGAQAYPVDTSGPQVSPLPAKQAYATEHATGGEQAAAIYKRLKERDQARLNELNAPQATPKQYQNAAAAGNKASTIQQLNDDIAGWQRGIDAASALPAQGRVQGGIKLPISDADKAQAKFARLKDAVRHVESRGNPNAVSPKGAEGTMQVMPGTQTAPGFGVAPARDKSPAELERVGTDYLQAMVQRYGDLPTALVAYNWGPGNADRWVASGKNMAALPAETRSYIDQVMARMGGQATQAAQGQPIQQAAAQPQPPQVAAGGPMYMARGQDPEAQQRAAQFQYYSRIAQTTGGQMQAQALMQLEQLRIADYGAKMTQMATAASTGDQQALQALVAQYARYTGAPVGVQVQNGQVIVHNGGGQVLASGTPDAISRQILTSLHAGLRQKQIEAQMAAQAEYAKNNAYWLGRGQHEKAADYARTGLEQMGKMTIEQAKILADRGEVQLARTADGTGIVAMTKDGSRTWVIDTGANIGGKITPPRMIPVAEADPNMLPGSMLYQKN